jgi:hypothetical protein
MSRFSFSSVPQKPGKWENFCIFRTDFYVYPKMWFGGDGPAQEYGRTAPRTDGKKIRASGTNSEGEGTLWDETK